MVNIKEDGAYDKNTRSSVNINEALSQELHKPVMKKSKRRKGYARFKDNIWATNVAERESLFSENWSVKYWLCVKGVLSKHAWVKQFLMVLLVQ